jgi:hypothetical protein
MMFRCRRRHGRRAASAPLFCDLPRKVYRILAARGGRRFPEGDSACRQGLGSAGQIHQYIFISCSIKLFCALPHLFAGLKVSMSLALVGAIVGEFVSSQRGLGYVILSAQGMFDTPRVFAAITILAVIGALLIEAVTLVERLALPWHHSAERQSAH